MFSIKILLAVAVDFFFSKTVLSICQYIMLIYKMYLSVVKYFIENF